MPSKKTKVLVAGTFDILHPGHLHFLKQAKKQGDFLIAVVARDNTVRKVKKHPPLNKERQRVKNLRKIKVANRIILGGHGDKLKIIEKIRPDIICLGYDQKAFSKNLRQELKKRGLKTKIIRLKSYRPKLYKSSLLRNK